MKKAMSLVLVLAMILSLAACTKKDKGNSGDSASTPAPTQATEATKAPEPTKADTAEPTQPEATPTPEIPWDGAYMEKEDFLAYTAHDLDNMFTAIEDQLDGDVYTNVKAAVEEGKAAIEAANTVNEARDAYKATFNKVLSLIPLADGLYSYTKLSNSERTNILGIMERYAVTTGITGISLFENGGYNMYNPRITLGTENYIVGYGFGILAEGAITADLAYETNDAWKRYYHTMESEDPGTLNYLNDQGAVVGDLYGYIGASFVTNFMNATKDGYDWVPELAKEKPVAVNDDDGDGMASTWRMEVRTGADGLKYKTGSEIASRKAFDGREVALEDYEYPFKLLLTQANALYRGSELANSTSGAIQGAKEYYNGSADGFNADLWANVGIKTYVENGKNYFEVTFTQEMTAFYAMYYISSSLYMPIPEDFIKLVTVQNYLGFNNDSTETPVDNSLSLGAYYVERYDSDQQIVYAKNPYYVYADTKYSIPGIHIKIFPAAKEDTTATFNEFLAEHFDAAGIPQEFLNDYRNDPRTRSTTGNSNFKLNVNACDQETWEYLFGENGVVKQTAKSDYWTLKPALGNEHFRKAIGFSIDRLTFANARGSIPSVDWLASNYMSDPENGISYSTTAAHKYAVETLLEDTDGNGYSLELARDYFRMALTELEKDGAYTPGTKDAPTELHIEIAWMYPTHEENYHNELKNFIETAFNDDSVCGGVYKLSVDFWVGNEWSDVYYNKMMLGQFDIGFGSISGNSLDPIGFLNCLSSDQSLSNGFTLNWGVDTNDPDSYPLVYDGMRWSFDALFNAANTKGIISQGQNKQVLGFDYTNIAKQDDGTYKGSFTITATLPDITKITVTGIMCCNYERYYNGDGTYVEKPVEFAAEDKGSGVYVVNFTVPAEVVTEFTEGEGLPEDKTGYTGFDLYYDLDFDGDVSSSYYSISEDHFN